MRLEKWAIRDSNPRPPACKVSTPFITAVFTGTYKRFLGRKNKIGTKVALATDKNGTQFRIDKYARLPPGNSRE
ncbi:MAG: hypothetical protein A2Y12_09715 [Planctomycetes bacterium GWF2_42_9]|nr:MAG: hypothetical protein A2Y12_09715 [Planctomycetes bacterium GWF2_42_9]